ncbi:MAG TPA: neutral/alkaline non-lysosomal ceramidase N-terminal domain-containing protein [Sandaracinaceae bacterium LLY-WYZ-13_1]|nr:neutral/alkaline non-lysosomal ceramidase N-terminal domain-containing protein [Sandaracinaceae bacterium LLY-WYZ-13_1]
MRRRARWAMATALLLAAAGCDGGDGETDAGTPGDAGPDVDAGADGGVPDAGEPDAGPFEPDSYCPGAPGCETGSGGTLEVGAAAVAITPTIDDTTDIITVDVDGDGEFEPGDGDEFADRDGVPGFQGVWIAGFGNARAASGVHDDLWARAIAMRNGDTTIVLVVLDLVGWFRTDMEPIRERVVDLDIDHVAIGATHTHQGRDTIGIWGITSTTSGADAAYNETVHERAAQAIRDAIDDLRPANVQYANVDLRDRGDVTRWVGDLRDPIILDPEMRIMRFVEAGGDATIATLVNFGAHAEYLDDENTLISSDWPHWFREGIENGVDGPDGSPVEGVGGVAVLVQSAIGGQIGPNGLSVETWEGTPLEQNDDVYRWTETVGEQLAYFALDALGDGGGSTTDETAALGYRTKTFYVDVQNTGYHVAILNRLFLREGHNWDPDSVLIPGENEPDLLCEVTVLDVGRAQWMTIPGELDPQLYLGGYDGSYTPDGVDIVHPDNPNPPDLSMAPEGPYLRDLARADAEQVWVLGLTNDYLGYFVPEYNYVLSEETPYLSEAPGDHYEETNSVGIDGWPTVRRELEALIAWTPDGD